ncbi:winged helix-turn-helix domain-containing protein [Jiangella alkaliphila]|uniref:winged helix-turn-helix domain-containing protein n=1 Tax=Jiangella alkaliphila TaxID=419479 RepID=UPI000699DA9E|nr:winged helix-turn-helix domain-containing protein [Jiangella alkaliphila]
MEEEPRSPIEGPGYRWENLADLLAGQIESGEIPPDAKLPSLRELSEDYEVSVNTAKAAVRSLRERGLVVTWHGGGSYAIGPQTRERLERRLQRPGDEQTDVPPGA